MAHFLVDNPEDWIGENKSLQKRFDSIKALPDGMPKRGSMTHAILYMLVLNTYMTAPQMAKSRWSYEVGNYNETLRLFGALGLVERRRRDDEPNVAYWWITDAGKKLEKKWREKSGTPGGGKPMVARSTASA